MTTASDGYVVACVCVCVCWSCESVEEQLKARTILDVMRVPLEPPLEEEEDEEEEGEEVEHQQQQKGNYTKTSATYTDDVVLSDQPEYLIGAQGGLEIADYLGSYNPADAIQHIHKLTGLQIKNTRLYAGKERDGKNETKEPFSLNQGRNEDKKEDSHDKSGKVADEASITAILRLFDLHEFRRADTFKMILEVAEKVQETI